jgi:hypothetical protein
MFGFKGIVLAGSLVLGASSLALSSQPASALSQLAVSDQYVCQILQSNVECWGDLPPFARKTFKRPQQIAGDIWKFCVLDDGNLQCWSKNFAENRFKEEQLPKPSGRVTSFAQTKGRVCVIDDGFLKCVGPDSTWILQSEVGQKYTRVAVIEPDYDYDSMFFVCGIAERGVNCWQADSDFKKFTHYMTALTDASFSDLAQGNLSVWVVGANGLRSVELSSRNEQFENVPRLVQVSGTGGTLLCGTTEGATPYCRLENRNRVIDQPLVPSPPLTDVVEVQPAEWGTVCALRKNSSVTCWGRGARFSRAR